MVDADPQAQPEDRLTCAALAFALTILFVCGGARAADQPVPQAPQAITTPAEKSADDSRLDLQKPEGDMSNAAESWWQKVLRAAPNCKSFSDGCRTCSLYRLFQYRDRLSAEGMVL